MRSTSRVDSDQWLADNYEALMSRVDTVASQKYRGHDAAASKRDELIGDITLMCIEMLKDGSFDKYDELTVPLVVKSAANKLADKERRNGELSRGQSAAMKVVAEVTDRLRMELGYEPNSQEVFDALPAKANKKQCKDILFNGLPTTVAFECSSTNDDGDDCTFSHDPVICEDDEPDWEEYNALRQNYLEGLSDVDLKVIEMKKTGEKHAVIAKAVGVSAPRVSQIVKRVVTDMNKLWGHMGYWELNLDR